jgi:hypothetical protein
MSDTDHGDGDGGWESNLTFKAFWNAASLGNLHICFHAQAFLPSFGLEGFVFCKFNSEFGQGISPLCLDLAIFGESGSGTILVLELDT